MKGNAGFFIYVADAVGYLGSVSVMLMKEGMRLQINWTQFFTKRYDTFFRWCFYHTLRDVLFFSKAKTTPLIQ